MGVVDLKRQNSFDQCFTSKVSQSHKIKSKVKLMSKNEQN